MNDIAYHIVGTLAAIAYGGASFLYIRSLAPGRAGLRATGRTWLCLAMLFQALFYISALQASRLVVASFPHTLSVVSLAVGGLFLLFERRAKAGSLGAFVAPLAFVFMLFASVLFHSGRQPHVIPMPGPVLYLHVASAIVANSLFILAFAVSLALLVQEAFLKKKSSTVLFIRLPALAVLDRLNSALLTAGFIMMTLSVSLGIRYSFTAGIKLTTFDPRLIWTTAILLVYGVIVSARWLYDWHGRRLALLCSAGFMVLTASFVGVNILGGGFHVF